MINRLASAALLSISTTAVWADVPRVITDIAPIHGLVSAVMEGVGEPDLLLSQGNSPHDFALRPSHVRALSQADVVFWTTETLAPWLGEIREKLAPTAVSIPLVDLPESLQLPFRENAVFEEHGDHGDEHDDHDSHEEKHDDHGDEHDEKHDDHGDEHDEKHDDHGDEHDDHSGHDEHGHDHSGNDPHAWLDPENAIVWVDVIANELAQLDPENASTYKENAAQTVQNIAAMSAEIQMQLLDYKDLTFIVFHDAYHYFEARFGISALGAISLSDSSSPSPARILELQEAIAERGVECVFSEPQFNPGLIRVLTEREESKAEIKSAVIDPLGTAIPTGTGFYEALIKGVADSVVSCR